jgi:hypothetical protein
VQALEPPKSRAGSGEAVMRRCRKSGSITNSMAANTSHTATIACIHQ